MSRELRPGEHGYRHGLLVAAMARRGLRLATVRDEFGVSYNHVMLCVAEPGLYGPKGFPKWRVPSRELAEKIAEFVGVPLVKLYPEVDHFRERKTA